MTELSGQLSQSSAQFARSALQGLPNGEHALFALHAGTALEHLAKAVLAKRHPALIAADDFDSLLHACGETALTKRPVMRTVNAKVSMQRVSRLVPRLANLLPDLDVLVEARNGVAHLASQAQAEHLRVPFLKAAEYLREALEIDRGEFWGEFVTLVDAALEESVEEATVRAANAIATARVLFHARYGHLDAPAREGVIHAIEAGYVAAVYDEQVIGCPACGSPALAAGTCETRWEQDDEDSYSFHATFIPGYLKCRACDLELDGEDELLAAGLDESWGIEADPSDFYEHEYEPDEYR